MKRVYTLILMMLLSLQIQGKEPFNPNLPRFLVTFPIMEKAQVFKGDGKYHLLYEFFLTNLSTDTLDLKTLTISGKGYEKIFQDSELQKMFIPAGNPLNDSSYKPVLEKGASATLFVFLNFATKEEIPPQLEHLFTVQFDGVTQNLPGQSIAVDFTPPLVIASPLQGDGWWTPNAASNDSHHRRALYSLDGKLAIAQRFGVDWMKFNEEGLLSSGDPKVNGSYFTYGQRAVAVADGEIVATNDGIAENTPGSTPIDTLTLETMMGNHVILKISENAYALYAHFIPGSLNVKVGDRVKKGDLLGLVGNSGNSTAPHLHFHIAEKPQVLRELKSTYPLYAQGIPFAIDAFTKINYSVEKKEEDGFPIKIRFGKQEVIKEEMIMTDDLTNFTLPNSAGSAK